MLFSSDRKFTNFLLKFCRGKRNLFVTSYDFFFFTSIIFYPFFWFLNISCHNYRLRAPSRPFIAFDPGMTRESLAYHGCAELFQVCNSIGDNYLKLLSFLCPSFNNGLGIFARTCILNSFNIKDYG